MATVDISIDGAKIKVDENMSILDAARENGIDIPVLCHDPRLEPFGACRLCLVEMEGGRRPMPACATKVGPGMVIKTNTEELATMRKTALELLLSTHYGDCEAPCKNACPAGIDIQGFVAMIADGQFDEAVRLINEQLPFPASVGRVCPAFCEKNCRRNLVDEPVAICDLKRFVGDLDIDGESVPAALPSTGCSVAVVGGGPGGLAAAYYLALQGHEVTVLEANDKLGGMMRYGIPEYRLPKALMDTELAKVVKLCREVKYNAVLGKDFTLDSLRKKYDAVFLAIGAQASQGLGIPGEDMAVHGIKFLRDVTDGKDINLGARVAIVGGGNTAIDCARTALRKGAQEVIVLYRRSEEEMPASEEEVREAREEGVVFQFLVNPVSLEGSNGVIQSCTCVRMALGEPDSSGRRRPVPVQGSEFQIQVDSVICAVGQKVDTACLEGSEVLDRNRVSAQSDSQKTRLDNVFAGGDCVSGPATVVEAVAAGKRAALAINMFLTNPQMDLAAKPYNHSKGELSEIDREEFSKYPKLPRGRKTVMEAKARRNGFQEVASTFTEGMARQEAMRCLSCGCLDAYECKLRSLATEYKAEADRFVRQRQDHFIQEDNTQIARDVNKCILCGSCIRICSEVQGIGALGFVGRGYLAVVKPSMGVPLDETLCTSCGQCISACPTGALTAKTYLPKPIPWKGEKIDTVCPQCSMNCDLELKIAGKKIIGTGSPLEDTVNEGNLCKLGAFEYDFIHSKDRITRPLMRKEGKLTEVSWPEAIFAACQGLAKVRDHLGGESLAVLASPNLTNEESYLVQKLARMAMRTSKVESLRPLPAEILVSAGGSLKDLEKADLVFAYKCDPDVDSPVLANKLRKMLSGGAQLVFAGPRVTRFAKESEMTIKVGSEKARYILKGMLSYLLQNDLLKPEDVAAETERDRERLLTDIQELEGSIRTKPAKLVEFTQLYLRAKNPVVIVNAEKIDTDELHMLRILAGLKNSASGIYAFNPYGNLYGQAFMGVNPSLLPGCRNLQGMKVNGARLCEEGLADVKEKADILSELNNGNLAGLLTVVNDDMKLDGLIKENVFNVVVAPLLSSEIARANVILPAATFAETQGTYLNSSGEKRILNKALHPLAGKENYSILAELSTNLGIPTDYRDITDLQKEIDGIV
ncbi:FAD-dependent oxidoreductase [Pelotomaculum terephthalicicum JT]|uniref:FAD-dependent oxidoreductase n=1 Tax=Pelotomaculum TaxID=191373 RepID=UPI0009C59305|nr:MULTISPECIES: FAD-dependent oxidoreductase [Pelotomaculum]MCG9968540.1 FAD-dependent oxidoreductase [Pelotomaculum terephthalicicum JT]OPX85019.1 MAG: Glutamate synthase (NADPH) small chain [Pelotomaculum sp. PtaB.Bin117]